MIERRKSKIHGWGVYATARIPKNTRIIHYAGEKIPSQESLKRQYRSLLRLPLSAVDRTSMFFVWLLLND